MAGSRPLADGDVDGGPQGALLLHRQEAATGDAPSRSGGALPVLQEHPNLPTSDWLVRASAGLSLVEPSTRPLAALGSTMGEMCSGGSLSAARARFD